LFRSVGKSNNYIRIEPENLASINPSMDAASSHNIQKIVALTDRLISDNENQLNQIVEDLIHDKKNSRERSVWNFLKN